MSISDALRVTRRGTITQLTIDDGKVNALSPELIAAIAAALGEAEADAATTAVVLAGREGIFSGGFDLGIMRSADPHAAVNLVADGGDLVRHIFGASKPVVAACTGHAIAAGALILLGCDARIGADGPYKIGLNEVAIGMVLPDWAETIAAERLVRPHYQRAVFNARLTDPPGAMAAGFLDRVVPPDTVIETAIAEAETLGALDPAAYRGSVARFRGPALERMAAQIAADRSSVT